MWLSLTLDHAAGETDVTSSHVDSPDHEFVSDSYQASSKDLEDVRAGIKSLGVDKKQSGKPGPKCMCVAAVIVEIS